MNDSTARAPGAACSIAAGLLSLLMASGPAVGWTPEVQLRIAGQARRLAPPDLRRQIERHQEHYHDGVLGPFRSAPEVEHYANPDGSGRLEEAIAREAEAAVAALRAPRPFEEIVYRLGVVSHFVADANNPLNSSSADPAESRYYVDYLRYVETAEPRFAVVFYAGEPAVDTSADLRGLVRRALTRSRATYPRVGGEYRRIGFGRGIELFDDRSTAFGIGAVSFSHAVSDVARVVRYLWTAGGGADRRDELWTEDEPLLYLLPRSGDANPRPLDRFTSD